MGDSAELVQREREEQGEAEEGREKRSHGHVWRGGGARGEAQQRF